jgi:hypothetical protein
MATFEITPNPARLELDRQRAGRVVFSVRNTSTRGLLAQARVLPGPSTPPEWLALEGETTRSYSAGTSLDLAVDVMAPMEAPPAEHVFHLEVVGVDLPDEDQGRSPDVPFLVARIGGGYVATLLGALAGGGIGVFVGLLPVLLALLIAVNQPTPSASSIGEAIGQILGQIVLLLIIAVVFGLIGVFGGLWVGPVVGAAIGLRLRQYEGLGSTVGFLAAIQPVWSALMIVAVLLLGQVVHSSAAQVVLLLLFAVIALAAPPWPARWLALWLRSRRKTA